MTTEHCIFHQDPYSLLSQHLAILCHIFALCFLASRNRVYWDCRLHNASRCGKVG